jgi:hypothetical protein
MMAPLLKMLTIAEDIPILGRHEILSQPTQMFNGHVVGPVCKQQGRGVEVASTSELL